VSDVARPGASRVAAPEGGARSKGGGSPDLGFDSRGRRRAGEIDLENRNLGTTIADMTAEDWAEAARLLRAWDAGWRP
jgi:hypothetical protein